MIIDGLKRRMYEKELTEKLNSTFIHREVVAFKNAKTIGILFNATQLEHHTIINDLAYQLKQEGKKVSILGFLDAKRKDDFLSFPYFSKSHLSWYGTPRNYVITDFTDKKIDVLINAFFDAPDAIRYVSRTSKAKCRIGHYSQINQANCDLMVQVETSSLEELLKECVAILKKINTDVEAN